MKHILIVGASSAIAKETARLYCQEDVSFYLVGRNKKKLEIVKDDLLTRGAERVEIDETDPTKLGENELLVSHAASALGRIDLAIIAHGDLPDQKLCQSSARNTIKAMTTNGISVISLATIISNYFEEQQRGTLVVLSSVAGDRGRAQNYIYGAAKSAVSTFLEGLSQRFSGTEISIITIKPGFVDTPMTKDFEKGKLWSQPEVIAEGIKHAIEKRKSIVYLPCYWRWIMLVIKLIPDFIFKKLSF